MLDKIVYSDPLTLLQQAERQMAEIPNEKLFNDPKHQKLREQWCTGMFGSGYSRYILPCEVAVNDTSHRLDADFFLKTANGIWDFQVAEVQMPDRRRGLEYRQYALRKQRTFGYTPGRGSLEGSRWIAEGIRKKHSKNYSNSKALNLLIYANFDCGEVNHDELQVSLETEFSEAFASIWIITSLHIGTIFSPADLGSINGWGVAREFNDYYE